MEVTYDIKRAICSLFEVHADEGGVHRVVTPLEYSGSGDKIVVRVRPTSDGFEIDESGDATLSATLCGGDVGSDVVARWADELVEHSPVQRTAIDVLSAFANDERLIVPYIFRVAEAAQQLHAIATSRADRQISDFKKQVADIVRAVVAELGVPHQTDVELPIIGSMMADHVLGTEGSPMILIAANSAMRLLEAEVIHMQYRQEKRPGLVVAIAESQAAVGKKQFERAGYFTSKSLIFNGEAFRQFMRGEVSHLMQTRPIQ